MKKTAIVYDKWLSSLGGGEVVACNIAKALIDNGYKTTFISGKYVDPAEIKTKLGIDLSKANFKEIWNDEIEIKKLTKNADVYVNASFMDYSMGLAKKNIFYTSFPTKAYESIKGAISSKLIIPVISSIFKNYEILNTDINKIYNFGHSLQKINKELRIAFSGLNNNKTYYIQYDLFLNMFSKSALENISTNIKHTKIISQKVIVDHHHNCLKYIYKIRPTKNTVYVNINIQNDENHSVYIIEPKILTTFPIVLYPQKIYNMVNNRLRAGFFENLIERMKSFQIVYANSQFTQKWVKKYWKRESIVLYPPVSLIKPKIGNIKKNIICSIGRFFTLGHGKKQEVLIEAFKNMCKQGLTGWELHLAGGLGDEPSSQEFVKTIEKSAKGYPVHFHYNKPKSFIENLYNSSKIYWHAAGYGENENKDPIKFEHFGIAPIEAISANCLPVLFNGGGLPDTINSLNLKSELYIFNTIPELIDKTNYLISNYQEQFKIFRNTQTELTKLYDEKVFRNKFIKQLNDT